MAGLKLAKRRGFETLEELSAYAFSSASRRPSGEALLAELNAAVKETQAELEASGSSLWHRALALIPFASAVKVLSDIPVALAQAMDAGVEMEDHHGTVVLKIEGVTLGDLPKTDLLGDSDPYVRLSFGAGITVRTKHIDGHKLTDVDRPQWNQTLELALPEDRTALHVEMYDHDPMPGAMAGEDDLMAEGWIDLAPLIPSWASQPEPEMEATSEHPHRVHNGTEEEQDDPDVLTYTAGLKTTEASLRGKKVKGGKPISLRFVIIKLEATVWAPAVIIPMAERLAPAPAPAPVATPAPAAVAVAREPAPPPGRYRAAGGSNFSENVVRTTSGWSYCPPPANIERGTTLYSQTREIRKADALRQAATNVAQHTQIYNSAPLTNDR